jgi:dihydrofolate reductase
MVKLIVAIDKNKGIGYGDKLPWNIKEELEHFRELTIGKTLLIGRKTAKNLPYLKDRKIYVLTNNANMIDTTNFNNECVFINKFPENKSNLIVAGGLQVYKEALTKKNYVDTIYLSIIKGDYVSTTIFLS